MTEAPQRRNFSRVRFCSGARLAVAGREYACEVCDLSLKGALTRPETQLVADPGAPCRLEFHLGDGDQIVRMDGEIVHSEDGRVGLVWREIDLDSITHLRRLLELNLGDPQLLDREISALIAD